MAYVRQDLYVIVLLGSIASYLCLCTQDESRKVFNFKKQCIYVIGKSVRCIDGNISKPDVKTSCQYEISSLKDIS